MSETFDADSLVPIDLDVAVDALLAPAAAGWHDDEISDEPNGLHVGPNDAPDRYALLGKGLRGGEGITWKAEYKGDLTHPVNVAVKQILRPANAHPAWPTAADLGRWRDQFHLVNAAPTTHLVRVREFFVGEPPHGAGTQQNPERRFALPYLVMEWVPGPTLDAAVRSGVDLVTLMGAVRDLADAVSSLHSATRTAGNPLLHRDIKPPNCVLAPGRGLVLVDLGTLRRIDEGEDPRAPHSDHYTAPEVLRDLAAPRAAASDLFAVGAVLYFCVTGREPPDPVEGAVTMVRELTAGAREHGFGRPEPLVAAVRSMMNADPAARPRRVETWAEEVSDLVTGSVHRRRVRRRLAAVGAATVLGAGALLGYQQFGGAPLDGRLGAPAASFGVFGDEFASFPAAVEDDRLVITPPLGQDRYDHLWGFFSPAEQCAATIEFDALVINGDRSNGFGLAIAPRSVLDGDQPYGYSVQYEWEPAYLTPAPGSYLRAAQLPGGAWKGPDKPESAPDIDGRHHIMVRAVGTGLEMTVDGVTARYITPAVECGGIAIRAWGAAMEFTNVRIGGS